MSKTANVKIAAAIVMIGIFLSRILGYARDMLINSAFGMGMSTDVLNAAFIIPDFMYQLLIGGTLSSAFIPIFTSYLSKDDEEKAWEVASNFANILTLAISLFVIVGIIFAPQFVPFIVDTNKFVGVKLELTIRLMRIVFAAIAFTSLAGFLIGVHNVYHRFIISSIGPIIYNVGIVSTLLIFGGRFGVEWIAYGYVVSAFAFLLFLVIGLKDKFTYYKWIVDFKQEGFHKIIKLAVPTIIGLSISSLMNPISMRIASSLQEGSVTAIKTANTVMWLPVGIFAAGIAIAMFPTLTKQISLNNYEEYKETFSLGLRTIFYIAIPATIGLIVLREPILTMLYLNGRFTMSAVRITSYALFYYSLGIVFVSGIQLLNRAFYSIHDTVTPTSIGAVSLIINLILNILFVKLTNLGIGGLALSASLSSAINMIVLSIIFYKKIHGLNIKRIIISLIKTSIAASIMGAVIAFLLENIIKYTILNLHTKLGQIAEVSILIFAGAITFGAFSVIFKMEEAQYFIGMFKRKLGLAKKA